MAIEGALFKQGVIWNPVVRRGLVGAVIGAGLGSAYQSISDSPNAAGNGAMLGGILGGLSGMGKLSKMKGAAELIGEKGNRLNTITEKGKGAFNKAGQWFEKTGLGAKTDDAGMFVRDMAEGLFGKQEWYSKHPERYNRMFFGAGKGAVLGAGVGAAYGLVSDNDSMFGGAVKGAMLGAVMGGIRYGASAKAYNARINRGVSSAGAEAKAASSVVSGGVETSVSANRPITDPSRLLVAGKEGAKPEAFYSRATFVSGKQGVRPPGVIPDMQEINKFNSGGYNGVIMQPTPYTVPLPPDFVPSSTRTKAINKIKSTLGTVGSRMSNAVSGTVNRMKSGLSSAGKKMNSMIKRGATSYINFGEKYLINPTNKLINGVSNTASRMKSGLSSAGKKMNSMIRNGATSYINFGEKYLINPTNKLINGLSKGFGSIGRGVSSAARGINTGIGNAYQYSKRALSSVGKSIQGSMYGFGSRMTPGLPTKSLNKLTNLGQRADSLDAIAAVLGTGKRNVIRVARQQGYTGTNEQIVKSIISKYGRI